MKDYVLHVNRIHAKDKAIVEEQYFDTEAHFLVYCQVFCNHPPIYLRYGYVKLKRAAAVIFTKRRTLFERKTTCWFMTATDPVTTKLPRRRRKEAEQRRARWRRETTHSPRASKCRSKRWVFLHCLKQTKWIYSSVAVTFCRFHIGHDVQMRLTRDQKENMAQLAAVGITSSKAARITRSNTLVPAARDIVNNARVTARPDFNNLRVTQAAKTDVYKLLEPLPSIRAENGDVRNSGRLY
jgi:hypothetical protein